MIYNVRYSALAHDLDSEVNSIIQSKKQNNSSFSVIDVGSSLNPWCAHITATIDINKNENSPYLQFIGNLNYFDVWNDVLSYVEQNGKFDFSICTHTLEDIANPVLVSKMLSRISKEGFVAVPSKYIECKRTNTPYRGWYHHRWLFNEEDSKIIAYPKLPFIEYLESAEIVSTQSNHEELSFYWSEFCDLDAVNEDYFCGEHEILNMYGRLTDK